MLVGDVLFTLVFGYLAVIYPCVRVHHARERGSPLDRWCSFFLCVMMFVVPLRFLPVWVPLRNDVTVAVLGMLAYSDAALSETIVVHYVHPQLVQLRMMGSLMWMRMTPRPPVTVDSDDSDLDEDTNAKSE